MINEALKKFEIETSFLLIKVMVFLARTRIWEKTGTSMQCFNLLLAPRDDAAISVAQQLASEHPH
jgi:hypothetical protein